MKVLLIGVGTEGVVQVMEVQMRPLVVAIPRFIQIRMPLPPLKSMAQSQNAKDQRP
jgi:hypothetical protein